MMNKITNLYDGYDHTKQSNGTAKDLHNQNLQHNTRREQHFLNFEKPNTGKLHSIQL